MVTKMTGDICNINAEMAFLGSIITDEKLIVKAIEDGIKPGDLTGKGFDIIYQCMLSIHNSKKPIEMVSLVAELKAMGIQAPVSLLTDMASMGITPNFKYYMNEIKDNSYKRKVKDQVFDLVNSLESKSPSEIKSYIEDLANKLDYGSVEQLFVDASEIKRTDLNSGLETGFKDLDALLGGLVYGSLTVLTGEPSSGKSTLLNQIVAQNIMNGHRCMLYSGELTDFNVLQWFMRAVANPSDLQEFKGKVGSYYDVTSHGEYSIRQWIKNKLFIYSEDSRSSVDNISVSIEYLARTKDVKLFVLDNMMTIDNSGLEELDKQKRLAKKLKSLARKYRICIILVAHPKKKGDKDKYHMHDVSGASEVVNLADYELILTRNIKVDGKTNDVSDITKIGILKNRTTGKQGISRRLNFDDMRKRFWIDDMDKIKDYGYDKVDQVSFVELDDVANDVPF